MGIMSRRDDDRANTDSRPAPPLSAIVVVVAAMAAAWIAAGSTGLLAHPLRHALTWLALGVAVVAGWPRRDADVRVARSGDRPQPLTLAAALVLGLIMTAAALPAVNVLAVTLITAALVPSRDTLRGRAILIAALATALLAVFRLASDSIPTVWLAADALGRALGWLGGTISGQPLSLGASFGVVDFLVLMAALYAGWLVCTAPPRLPRVILAALAILLGHLIYLAALGRCGQILAALPEVVLPPEADNSRLGIWAWGNAVRTLLPWNLPALAVVIHATIAALMFRWAAWLPVTQRERQRQFARQIDALLKFGPATLALSIALLTLLGLGKSDLDGKTVVANQEGFLNWDKPQFDTRSTGMYGMLEPFVESLGGKFVKSADLSAEDLDEADVLLLLHPNQDWPKQPETLDRIWEFVRGGGSLLVVADPEIRQGDSQSTLNDLLEPTAMRVRGDTANSATNNWEHSCQPLAHAATAGIGDRRNRFGLMMGSSIQVGWPARPLVVGRWAWSDPGSDAVATGAAQYDPGEKLGDLVLAAEQPLGRGTVIVLADTSSLHNDVLANSYTFAGRLLGYLAGRPVSPQAWWRQLAALLFIAAFVGLLAWRASALRTGVAAAVLAGCLIGCVAIARHTTRVLPGSGTGGPKLACIDASHLEAYSTDTWGNFGIAGLSRTLMRSGYLPLLLPELTPRRLDNAELLISIGPARQFSRKEQRTVRDFVDSGGTFICMAGAEEVAASRELIEEFGFKVPHSPVAPGEKIREPAPLGAVSTLYLNTDEFTAAMQSYASWEVECNQPDRWKMAQWSDGTTDRPFAVSRPVGDGWVVVIGDTYLAVNQNLESAVNAMPENVDFWRWLLTHVTGQDDWTPPPPRETEPELPAELPPEEPELPGQLPPEDPTQDDTPSHEVTP